MFFESHAHYDDKRFNEDRDELLKSLQQNGIDYVINIGADMKSSQMSVALAKKYDFIYTAVGVHPHDAASVTEADIETLRNLCNEKKVVAIGEIGLDYYYEYSPKEVQRDCFKHQLQLAEELDKPVVIHSRDAAQECFSMIEASKIRRGVVHCYSGSVEMAKEYVKLGYYLGIGGVITFDKTKKLAEVVENIPMEHILIETDSPYLAPVPNRGNRNDSHNLLHIAKKISEIKQIPLETVAEVSFQNAVKLFQIPQQ